MHFPYLDKFSLVELPWPPATENLVCSHTFCTHRCSYFVSFETFIQQLPFMENHGNFCGNTQHMQRSQVGRYFELFKFPCMAYCSAEQWDLIVWVSMQINTRFDIDPYIAYDLHILQQNARPQAVVTARTYFICNFCR